MSGDTAEKAAAFRSALDVEALAFVSDRSGALMRAYGVKIPLLALARRVTFVIGKGRRILRVDTGGGALDAGGAVEACSLR